jgi:cytochrome d ubiquinol oxidase subunit I
MDLDVVLLSRIQFALTIMFHYLFPPLSIGLGTLMVVMEGLFLRTRDPVYETMTRFWSRVFAVNFAVGVATGVVMEFQFGTNWSAYSRFVGDVFGSALAAEGIFAFFLESGFLAVLVFGWDRVSPRMHFFSTCMVALGSIFSAVWIVVANSWQQTPAGHHVVELAGGGSRAEIVDFWAMVFNPSSMHRLVHVLLGSWLVGAFFVMSVGAYYILKGRHLDFARRSFRIALVLGAASSLAMPVSGHFQAKTVARTQPAKLAAFEGHFETGPAGVYLFGWPDGEERRVKYGLAIPGLLGFLVHEDFDASVTGLADIPREDWPPLQIPFQTYHVMVALGMFFIAVTLYALFCWWRGTLFTGRWLLRILVVAVGGAFVANQAGWVAAEVGRQPWVVYGLLRTGDAVSKSIHAGQVMTSIAMFGLIYALLFAVWVFVLDHKLRHGPDDEAPRDRPGASEPPDHFIKGAAAAKLAPGSSLTSAE